MTASACSVPRLAESVVGALVFRAALEHGSRTALIYGSRRWTFDELAEAVAATANRIAVFAGPGERVAVIGNSDRAAIALLAATANRAIAVPVHPDTPASRLHAILTDCAPALVVANGAGALASCA